MQKIPGTTKMHRMRENNRAADLQLSSDDLREIAEATSRVTVQGARCPEQMAALTGR